jgi:hypothetical protein
MVTHQDSIKGHSEMKLREIIVENVNSMELAQDRIQ